jgi:hypothetical protein
MQNDAEITHDFPDTDPDMVVTYNANALRPGQPPSPIDARD